MFGELALYSISSGSSFVEFTTSGSGIGRLFEGGGGDLYIYYIRNAVWVSRDAAQTFSNVIPSGATMLTTLAQKVSGATYTTVGCTSGSSLYQVSPETQGGWASTSALPTSFLPSDSVGDDTVGKGAVLIGNFHVGTEFRVVRAISPPFSWTQSDSGLPVGASNISSRITDLERGE